MKVHWQRRLRVKGRPTRHERTDDEIKSAEKRADQRHRGFACAEVFFDRFDEHSWTEDDTVDHHVTAKAGKLLKNFVNFQTFSRSLFLTITTHPNPPSGGMTIVAFVGSDTSSTLFSSSFRFSRIVLLFKFPFFGFSPSLFVGTSSTAFCGGILSSNNPLQRALPDQCCKQ